MSNQGARQGRSVPLLLAGMVAVAAWAASAVSAPAAESDAAKPVPRLRLFSDEAEAKAHCPNDTVIRIDLPEGFYLHGDRGFGGASLGRVFICRDEAARLFSGQRS